jgi:hypothetical protein
MTGEDVPDPVDAAAAAVAEVQAAADERAAVEREMDDTGRDAVERLAGLHDRATRVLERYEESATGTGQEQFQNYLQFQDAFATVVDDVGDDVPDAASEAFEAAAEAVDRRTLRERDFANAREALAPVERYADLIERREAADDRLRRARATADRAASALADRIERLERLVDLGDADLSAPVERLRDPIETYDGAIRADFEAFVETAGARAVLSFVDGTTAYPLVDYRQPPPELLAYVREKPAGEEPIPTLLEYADYSPSKADHYVDDVGALRTKVAVHRTYLERIDGEPLTVGWPPPAAGTLTRRARELVSVVGPFADESTVAALRAVRDLPRTTDYERLRTAAVARTEVDDEERDRLESGAVAAELKRARELRTALEAALDESD